MGFVRIKKIKGNKYAYLVESNWTKKGPRQKTKKYLGKVYSPRREKDLTFFEYFDDYKIDFRNQKELIQDTIKLELVNYGFTQKESGVWERDGYFIDVKNLKFFNSKGKNVAIELNDGALCKPLIDKIVKLKIDPLKEDYEKEGYGLAKLLVESGLKVDSQIFIKIYDLARA